MREIRREISRQVGRLPFAVGTAAGRWDADMRGPSLPPYFFILINRPGSGHVRINAGAFGRSFWIHWD